MMNWQGTSRSGSWKFDAFLSDRYLFVLQLKDDIRTGKLECPSGTDVELGALSMQGKWRNSFSFRCFLTSVIYGWWTIPSLIDVNGRTHVTSLSFLAELGDYTSDEHTVETISEFRLLPDQKQTEEFEGQVLQKWSTNK